MFKLGGSIRARVIAAVAIAAVPVALALPIELVDGSGPGWNDRESKLAMLEPDDRVQIVGLDEDYFAANPGPLTAPRLADLVRQLRDLDPAVVAFNFDLSAHAADHELAEALSGIRVVSVRAGDLRLSGRKWHFEPAPTSERRPSPTTGVGRVPRSNGLTPGLLHSQLIGAEVPLEFDAGSAAVPAFATAAVREFARVTDTPDPLTRHGMTARFRGAREASYMSAAELSGNAGRLAERLVFVGLDFGEEHLAGPFGIETSDDAFHASVGAHALMARTLLAPPIRVARAGEILIWTFAVALLVAVAVLFLPIWASAVLVLAGCVLWFSAVLDPYSYEGLHGHLKLEFPTAAIFVALAGALTVRYVIRRSAATPLDVLRPARGTRRARLFAALGAAGLAFAVGGFGHAVGFFGELHEKRTPVQPPLDLDRRIQTVVFDDEYFDRHPGPLTLQQVAAVAEQIRGAEPAVVAFNLRIARNLNDPALAAALEGLRLVDLDAGSIYPQGGDWAFTTGEQAGPRRPPNLVSAVGLIPTERNLGASKVPLEFLGGSGRRVPALATAAVQEFARSEGLADPLTAHGLDRPGRWPVPTTHYRSRLRSPELIPAHELANHTDKLKDALVFVGVLTTERFMPEEEPFGAPHNVLRNMPGPGVGGVYGAVDLHAELAATLLQPPLTSAVGVDVLGSSLPLALVPAFAAVYLTIGYALAVSVAALAAWWFGVVAPRFFDGGNFLFETPIMVFLVAVVAGFAVRLYSTRQEADRLSVLTEYVPPAVVMALTGPKRNRAPAGPVVATVLYTDVRGYTTLAGELDAARVKDALDVYYSVLGAVVSEHEGSLLYYAGDGMVVTFEAASPTAHAERAVACGAAMQGARSRMAYMLGQLDLPPLEFGVGIHTGEVIIGAVGSEHHRQFTALGEAVNIASRMCAVAEGGQVCLTEQTRQLLMAPPPLVDLGELQLKNVIRGIQGWRISEVLTVA